MGLPPPPVRVEVGRWFDSGFGDYFDVLLGYQNIQIGSVRDSQVAGLPHP